MRKGAFAAPQQRNEQRRQPLLTQARSFSDGGRPPRWSLESSDSTNLVERACSHYRRFSRLPTARPSATTILAASTLLPRAHSLPLLAFNSSLPLFLRYSTWATRCQITVASLRRPDCKLSAPATAPHRPRSSSAFAMCLANILRRKHRQVRTPATNR